MKKPGRDRPVGPRHCKRESLPEANAVRTDPWAERRETGTAIDPLTVLSDERDARSILRMVLDAIPQRIFWKDREGRYLGANRPFAHDAGVDSPEELLGKTDFDLPWKGLAAAYVEDDQRVMESGRPSYGYEEPLTRADGSTVWLRTSKIPIRNGNGAVVGVLGSYEDITEQREAKRALERSEESVRARLEVILSPAGDAGTLRLADVVDVPGLQAMMDGLYRVTRIGFALIDLEGRVLVATGWQDICTLFHRVHPETLRNCVESDTVLSAGVEPGQVKLYRCKNGMWDIASPVRVGARHMGNVFLGQFFFTEDEPDLEAFRAQARLHGFDEEAYLAALGRVPRWPRATVEGIVAFYARLAALISTLSFQNVTLGRTLAERDRLLDSILEGQEQIRALNTGLERRVAARTAELEAANRELASFSRTVSHDLRAPLRAVAGFSSILAEEAFDHLSDEERGHVDRIRAGVHKMMTLIDDLLRLARATRSELATARTDLGSLAVSLAREIHAEEPERRVTWVIAAGIEAECDAGLLRVVLENLLRNAWKFTSHHEAARIEFGEERNGQEQTFFVRDDGAGFDPRYAGKLFAPFQRLHPETEFPGSGVGLATVANVVRRHGGRVWAEGEKEKGATFWFTLEAGIGEEVARCGRE